MASDDGREGGGLSSGARVALVVGAVVLLVGAFLIARGGDDEAPTQTQSQTQATTSDTTTGPESQTTPDHSGRDDEQDETETQTQTQPQVEPVRTVRVRGGRPLGGVKTLTYRNGDRIRLRVVADAADEVHVHGFDITRAVAPSEPARFNFGADIEGRFEVFNLLNRFDRLNCRPRHEEHAWPAAEGSIVD